MAAMTPPQQVFESQVCAWHLNMAALCFCELSRQLLFSLETGQRKRLKKKNIKVWAGMRCTDLLSGFFFFFCVCAESFSGPQRFAEKQGALQWRMRVADGQRISDRWGSMDYWKIRLCWSTHYQPNGGVNEQSSKRKWKSICGRGLKWRVVMEKQRRQTERSERGHLPASANSHPAP